MTSKNNRAPLLYYIKLCASFQIHRSIQIEVTVWKRSIRIKISIFPVWPWKTLENNREPLLDYIKLCASFQSHGWIPTIFTVWKRSIRVKIGTFLSRVTLKFDGWPWKNNRVPLLTSSIQHQALCFISKPWVNSIWSYSPEMLNSGQNR